MKMRIFRSKTKTFITISILVILVLTLVLFNAERTSTQSAIRTYFDALLFSIVTIVKLGYSDIIPATSTGRIIFYIFKVMNIGFYLLIISAGFAFVRGRSSKPS
ncbi:MAG: hypothetical protein CMB80_13070 [Flammeovirgaceae bacterium]|mgnify:FL=1|nr:hypothetical protein [Flammeovirgaceae bacterium]MBR08777.1 hypothetical protein [Rickettsiales bacterium]